MQRFIWKHEHFLNFCTFFWNLEHLFGKRKHFCKRRTFLENMNIEILNIYLTTLNVRPLNQPEWEYTKGEAGVDKELLLNAPPSLSYGATIFFWVVYGATWSVIIIWPARMGLHCTTTISSLYWAVSYALWRKIVSRFSWAGPLLLARLLASRLIRCSGFGPFFWFSFIS